MEGEARAESREVEGISVLTNDPRDSPNFNAHLGLRRSLAHGKGKTRKRGKALFCRGLNCRSFPPRTFSLSAESVAKGNALKESCNICDNCERRMILMRGNEFIARLTLIECMGATVRCRWRPAK